MFIRCVLDNIYSFGRTTEINMFPAPRFSRLKNHKYQVGNGIEVLKLASFYGANGSGKSNLVLAIEFLRNLVVSSDLPSPFLLKRMKHFHSTDKPTLLAIEFLIEGKAYLYALELGERSVLKEELYISGLGKSEDILIFERSTTGDGKTSLQLSEENMQNKEILLLKEILEKNLIKPNKTALKIIADLENPVFYHVCQAFRWFEQKLVTVTPTSKPLGLPHLLDIDESFHKYAEDLLCSFDVGIKKILTTQKTIEEFFGDDNKQVMDKIVRNLENRTESMVGYINERGEEVVIVVQNNKIVVKQLQTLHEDRNGKQVIFNVSEESDGSQRLIEFLPAFRNLLASDVTYFIDELERSIHPLLIIEIIKKFSKDMTTKGQLIFTTHESNLLNQEFFRQDEIWFVEKDTSGCTDLYSLCDFKEHNTKDIQKGYLTGRYGAIPFLTNLNDLNWDKYDFKEPPI